MTQVKHPCRKCGQENPRWPYGFCPPCDEKETRREARLEDALNQMAATSYTLRRLRGRL